MDVNWNVHILKVSQRILPDSEPRPLPSLRQSAQSLCLSFLGPFGPCLCLSFPLASGMRHPSAEGWHWRSLPAPQHPGHVIFAAVLKRWLRHATT